MSYVLEWITGNSSNRSSIVRQVRVFRHANGIKAFLRSRAFQRHAGAEIRIQLREGHSTSDEVITSVDSALAWDLVSSRLPEPLPDSNWKRELSSLTVRAGLVRRWRTELEAAEQLGVLEVDQVVTLVAALEIMIAETFAAIERKTEREAKCNT